MSAPKEKLSELLSAYFCGKCGYLGSEGPDHLGCGYSAFRDRRYHMAVDLETALQTAVEALTKIDNKVRDPEHIARSALAKIGKL